MKINSNNKVTSNAYITKMPTSSVNFNGNNLNYNNEKIDFLNVKDSSKINLINFTHKPTKYAGFELNLSEEEMSEKLSRVREINLIDATSPAYLSLKKGDKIALKHLVKAAAKLDSVFLKQDDPRNIILKKSLQKAANLGDKKAESALDLFKCMNGINRINRFSQPVQLFKDIKPQTGKAFFPEGVTSEDLIETVLELVKQNKKDEVETFLSPRSVIVKNHDGKLVSVDYTEYFSQEFTSAANELELAAQTATDTKFVAYLQKQAEALRVNNPELDAQADKLWAELQDSPLEFTIGREGSGERLSPLIAKNDEIKEYLKIYNIPCVQKDCIGVRVGILNKSGTDHILKVKGFLPKIASLMPLSDSYVQTISTKGDAKQNMTDVDLVYMTGDYTSSRFLGPFAAQNLPNPDKLAVKRNYSRKNVYHRQVRQISDDPRKTVLLDALFDKSVHRYYDLSADLEFTIGHENGHSFGPKEYKDDLGDYKDIIEEAKADMVSTSFLDYFVKNGLYDEDYKKKILTSFVTRCITKGKPGLFDAPHKARALMQFNYFREKNAITIDKDNKIIIHYDKFSKASYNLLERLVKIQLSRDPNEAKKIIDEYFYWDETLEAISNNYRSVDNNEHFIFNSPLADKLLKS